MAMKWWKIQVAMLAGASVLAGAAQAAITDTDLPYTIGSGAEVAYRIPGETVAFNGMMEGDPSGTDIIIRFAYYVSGPMTIYASKDGLRWTWLGDSNWMTDSASGPYTTTRLAGNPWDPDDWAKYIRIYNRTYRSAPYNGVIVLTGIEPLFPGRDPTLPPANQAPVADAGGPYVAFATSWDGGDVQLDASGSSDPDGDVLSYAWDFGNDGSIDSTEESPTGFFALDQTSVRLTVSDNKGGSHSVVTTVTVSYEAVPIDIKPESTDNVINMGSNGVVPVAFLSSADPIFDATTINPATVALRGEDGFVPGLVRMRGKNGSVPQASLIDVNGDGLVDLLVHIETEKLADEDIQAQIFLGAMTFDGQVLLGFDAVTVINQQ